MSAREPDPELLAAAQAIHLRAYCPYSHYRVGAAIRTASGTVVAGCNVENAAYPLGSCAEAGAIAAMVAAGERAIVEIVIVTDGDEPGTPAAAAGSAFASSPARMLPCTRSRRPDPTGRRRSPSSSRTRSARSSSR